MATDKVNNPSSYMRGHSGKSKADEYEAADLEDTKQYRKRKDYSGYEDYTPSGRAALREYNSKEQGPNLVAQKGGIPYDPQAAKAAQKVQQETMDTLKRESRGTVVDEKLAKGGTVGKKINGIAQRGKTRGKMC